MIIHKCDKKGCPSTHEQARGERASPPKGWYEFSLAGTYGQTKVWYEICEGCRKALEIPDMCPDQSVGQRLLVILEDLVTDAVEAQQE